MGIGDWLLRRRLDDASLEEDHPDLKAASDLAVSDLGSFLAWVIFVVRRRIVGRSQRFTEDPEERGKTGGAHAP